MAFSPLDSMAAMSLARAGLERQTVEGKGEKVKGEKVKDSKPRRRGLVRGGMPLDPAIIEKIR
jgi:hypothetical protein